MSLNYTNVNSNSVTLNGLPFTITATYNQGPAGTNRNLYEVRTTLSDYDWRRADLKDYALALLKIWSQDPSNSRKLYYVLNSGHDEWPAGTTSATKSTQASWPNSSHDASEIEGKHVQLNIFCSDDITDIVGFAKPYSFGGLRTRNVIVGFQWNLFGTNPAGPLDDYGNAQPVLDNGFTSGVAPSNYWQYIWLPNNHINGNPPAGPDIANHYYLEKIDQLLIDNTITDYVADPVNKGLTQNTTPTPPPTYDYSYYGHPASWTKIGCVSLPVKAVSGAVNSSTTNPIPAGNYVSGDFEIILENSALADFKSIFESFNPSGAIPDPVWILDAASYSTQTAGFWNWYDNGSGDGGFFPTTMMGNMSGYSLGARIPGAKPGRIDWKWDHGGIKLTLKGNIQVDEDIPYTGWNLEMCLLKFNAFTGPYPPDTTAPTIVSQTPAPGATNVSVNTPITITFSEELDLQASRTLNNGAGLDPTPSAINPWIWEGATYTYASKVLTITPTTPFSASQTVTVSAPSGIKDLAGNALASTGWQFTTEVPAAPPEIVNIHFYYNPGSVIDKAGNLDDVSATYQAPLESAAAIFLVEFDKPIDPSSITSAPTKPIGIIDRTELNSTGNLTYVNQVTAAGFGVQWWKYYDDVHNLTSTGVGGFTTGFLNDGALNNNITSSSPMSHCIYVAIPGGVLKAGHEYSIWHIPEYIKGTDNTPMNRYNTGTAYSATWDAGSSQTEMLLKIEAPAGPPPQLVRMHFFYPGGWSDTKTDLHFDDLSPTHDAPEDLGTAGTFVFEFDKPIDSGTAQKYSTSSGGMFATTPFIGVTDYTAIINGIGAIAFAGSNGGRWWEVYNQYNIEPIGINNSGVGVYPFNLSNMHSSLNAPPFHCLYFTAKVGALLADHEYRPYLIPSLVTDTSNVPLGSSTLPEFTFNGRVLKWKVADSIAPTIVSKTPANGATGVHVNASITVTFSEEVTLPVGQNVTYSSVNQAGNWISQPAHVVYSSKTVTITPTNPLPGTSIINVAVPSGVTDSAGNALALQSWSFMTAAPPDTRVPIEAYAIGFTKDPDNFKSIPLTKSGTITQEFKIPAVDIDGPKIMYLRLRDQDGLISTNYRIALRVLDFELETFEVDTHGYCGGTTNQIDVLFDTDTDPATMEYGFLIDDSGEPTVWNPVTPLSYDSVGKYKFNFNLDVSVISSGQHDLYVWLRTLEGEKKFCKTDFVSEPIPADPYGILTIKKSMIDGAKKKVWVEANIFDAGVGVSAISFVESINPASFESINIIQNKRITKLFEYDASANTTNTFNLIIEDAVGRTSALITTSIDLSGVY